MRAPHRGFQSPPGNAFSPVAVFPRPSARCLEDYAHGSPRSIARSPIPLYRRPALPPQEGVRPQPLEKVGRQEYFPRIKQERSPDPSYHDGHSLPLDYTDSRLGKIDPPREIPGHQGFVPHFKQEPQDLYHEELGNPHDCREVRCYVPSLRSQE